MLIFGVIAYVGLGLAIVILSGLHISVNHNLHELSSRAGDGDKAAKLQLQRQQSFYSLLDLKNIALLVLVVGFTAVGIARFGWSAGIIISIAVVGLMQIIARLKWIGRLADRAYSKYEPAIIRVAELVDQYSAFVGITGHRKLDKFQIQSKDEMLDLIKHSRGVENIDKRAIAAQMAIGQTKVDSLMIAAADVDYVSYSELLGPLVLHDLHKTGHRWFPVVRDGLDGTLGFLDSRDVLTIDSKKSVKARTAMQHEVVRISQDDSLAAALETYMKTGSWIMLVTGQDKKVVGLIGLPDIINYLQGKAAQ